MRLLKRAETGAFSLTDDLLDQDIPQYVILSHTWGPAQHELSLQDFQRGTSRTRKRKNGSGKIQFCGDQAAQDGYQYFWIDTCCIDKTNSVELTESINSMFRWYRQAQKCYVYLSDVTVKTSETFDWLVDFRKSRWFTRGWTLQELLAPKHVEFFSSDGVRLGDKVSLEGEIHHITGIALDALRGKSLSAFSVLERMDWASKRVTSRTEDRAYSLLGIFDVHMPLIYGEREKAFERLREHIQKSSVESIWSAYINADKPRAVWHPVRKNYQKVYVSIVHWKVDELQDLVQRISHVFHHLYHYDVRTFVLPCQSVKAIDWPWRPGLETGPKDLQILYYLGSTTVKYEKSDEDVNFVACPYRKLSSVEELPPSSLNDSQQSSVAGLSDRHDPAEEGWLPIAIQIPLLISDVFIVLDCFVEQFTGPSTSTELRFLLDDNYCWARYLLLCAGYRNPLTPPGGLSVKFMSLLENLATSGRFYAEEGLVTSGLLREMFERQEHSNSDLDLHWYGTDDQKSVPIAPLTP